MASKDGGRGDEAIVHSKGDKLTVGGRAFLTVIEVHGGSSREIAMIDCLTPTASVDRTGAGYVWIGLLSAAVEATKCAIAKEMTARAIRQCAIGCASGVCTVRMEGSEYKRWYNEKKKVYGSYRCAHTITRRWSAVLQYALGWDKRVF
jgi:hypothetical protein